MSLEKPTPGELATIAGIIAARDSVERQRQEQAQGIYASDLPWPFCYKYSLVWRIFVSGASIMLVDNVLERVFNLGPDFICVFWCFLVAFIPFVGSTWMTGILLVAYIMWAPPDPLMVRNMEYSRTKVCYTTECFNSR